MRDELLAPGHGVDILAGAWNRAWQAEETVAQDVDIPARRSYVPTPPLDLAGSGVQQLPGIHIVTRPRGATVMDQINPEVPWLRLVPAVLFHRYVSCHTGWRASIPELSVV